MFRFSRFRFHSLPLCRRGIIQLRITIASCLRRFGIWPVLLYRRLRYGYAFRLIRLAGPRYAKVDPADYHRLRQYEWFLKKGKNTFYALRTVPTAITGKHAHIFMHREVIHVPEGMMADHVNHDGLDNRTANLRPATRSQNMCHRKKRSAPTHSKYKGISWVKRKRKWHAQIMFQKKRIHLGYFRDEIEAARAYDRAAMKYHAEFASLNFPESASG